MSTADSRTPARTRLGPTLFAASMGATFLLQACAPHLPSHTSLPVYAIDQTGGARSCTVSPLTPPLAAGKQSSATMTLADDGGWCAISVHQDGPAPFTAGLLTTRPEHGKVYIHSVGDETRLDYTPEPHFGGSDAFLVTLIPGDATVRVAVTVAGTPEPPQVEAPVKPPPKPSARKVPVKR